MESATPDRDTAPTARDLLTNRTVITDTVVPPVLFVGANALLGLAAAAGASVGLSLVLLAVRLLRRQRLLYATSGLAGTLTAVGFALWAGQAEAYFLPGVVTNAVFGVVAVASVLVRRPLIALTSAAIYRWPLGWYWHPRVRPAYSEITWAWAALYLTKAGLQWVLVQRAELGWLAVARILTGWPAFALLLLGTYAYVDRRLRSLGGPNVEQYRAAAAPEATATGA